MLLIFVLIVGVQPRTWHRIKDYFTKIDIKTQLGIKEDSRVQDTTTVQNKLKNMVYDSKSLTVVVNNNQPNLRKEKIGKNNYFLEKLDFMGRVQGGKIRLTSPNVFKENIEKKITVNPTGWYRKTNKKYLKKVALLPKVEEQKRNVITGTQALTAQMKKYEDEIENRMRANNESIDYQVEPIYNGINSIASGVHLQAQSDKKDYQLNVYIFNEQPEMKLNHLTGTIQKEEK